MIPSQSSATLAYRHEPLWTALNTANISSNEIRPVRNATQRRSSALASGGSCIVVLRLSWLAVHCSSPVVSKSAR